MKISASVYSGKNKTLETIVKELDAHMVDYFHIDCNDDLKVFDDIKAIRKLSKTPIDLHIISSQPEKYYDLIKETNVELVTFQHENLKDGLNIPSDIKSSIGIAVVSETDINVFEKYAGIDFILFMTTTPGKSGGAFDKYTFKKIRKFRQQFPEKRIHVDGGVNADISFVLRNMGVYSVVSGSYLFTDEGTGSALYNLRNPHYSPSGLHVKDFMLGIDEIPFLQEKKSTFIDVLKSIDKYNLGFTLLTDDNNKFVGLISNADIRKGLIKKIDALNTIQISDIINRTPLIIYDDFSIAEMIEFIKSSRFSILYLPVLDRENNLTGAVSFTGLIKGE